MAETVTLVATAIADGTVSFQWQRQEDDGSWTNIEQAELMTRAMMLRAASEQTDELIVPLSEAGWYRCLITYNKGNTSTTLVAYAEVSDDGDVEEPENPEEDNPNLPDSPDYYNIYIETCEGVEATLSTTIVREGNSMTFTLETEEGYTDENMTVKFKQSMFGYWETITPNEKGVYLIRNIYADIYITVDGVEEGWHKSICKRRFYLCTDSEARAGTDYLYLRSYREERKTNRTATLRRIATRRICRESRQAGI